jgi:hypothetical protein
MRTVALLALLAAALGVPSVAAAATPQGKLTGTGTTIGAGETIAITQTVTDGGTSYVGLENDKSGTCEGDTGAITHNGTPFDIVCAHFVASSRGFLAGSPKMRFAFALAPGAVWEIVRIVDNGTGNDTFASGFTFSLADAHAWVNVGAVGSGHTGVQGWSVFSLTQGSEYTVAP